MRRTTACRRAALSRARTAPGACSPVRCSDASQHPRLPLAGGPRTTPPCSRRCPGPLARQKALRRARAECTRRPDTDAPPRGCSPLLHEHGTAVVPTLCPGHAWGACRSQALRTCSTAAPPFTQVHREQPLAAWLQPELVHLHGAGERCGMCCRDLRMEAGQGNCTALIAGCGRLQAGACRTSATARPPPCHPTMPAARSPPRHTHWSGG